jgi:nitrogen PTS system EIIA component
MSRIMVADLITPALILPTLHAAGRQQALEKLSRLVARHAGLSQDDVKQAVISRGDLTSFGLGRGVAIPHATVPGISRPVCAFARLKTPVDFGAGDGQPADLVFLLLAPKGDDITLLRALSCVARRLRQREVAETLRAATSAEASHIILTTDAWREWHAVHAD